MISRKKPMDLSKGARWEKSMVMERIQMAGYEFTESGRRGRSKLAAF